MNARLNAAALAAIGGFAACASAQPAVVDFEDNMTHGWSINGHDVVSNDDGGNPGARLHWDNFVDTFWLETRNNTNPDFIGDYTAKGDSVTLSIDVQVDFIQDFIGNPIPRDLILELRDYDNPSGGTPYNSVWYNMGLLPNNYPSDWTTMSVTIDDTSATDLPAGWGGYGAEDPNTFEPILPPDRTFTDILDGVDEILFTTAQPGFFYTFAFFNVSVDNISITPAPGVPMIGALGALAMVRRRR